MNAGRTKVLVNLRSSAFICGFIFLAIISMSGCQRDDARRVVLYTSVDQPVAAPIVAEFEKATGIKVVLVTDTEATKSVGLAERLRAEKANPQADVWWGNEPFHTISLADEGLLDAYESPAAKEIDERYRDPGHRWAGNGARVRVLAVAQDIAVESIGLSWLADPAAKGRIAMARPSAGTTGGHVAALYILWGDAAADEYFRKLRGNGMKLLGGNGPVAEAVGAGLFRAGLTDNDDVVSAAREGGKLRPMLPDQDGAGTLVIPTTVALVAGAKHPDDARQLVDYLISAPVEQALLDARFAYGSVRRGSGPQVKAMDVDYRAVARKLPDAVRRSTSMLEGRE